MPAWDDRLLFVFFKEGEEVPSQNGGEEEGEFICVCEDGFEAAVKSFKRLGGDFEKSPKGEEGDGDGG